MKKVVFANSMEAIPSTELKDTDIVGWTSEGFKFFTVLSSAVGVSATMYNPNSKEAMIAHSNGKKTQKISDVIESLSEESKASMVFFECQPELIDWLVGVNDITVKED